MGTAISKVLCDENGFGGDGEYSGDNDAQLDLINLFYYWASDLATQCGILLPVFRALVFGLALCFGESIKLT